MAISPAAFEDVTPTAEQQRTLDLMTRLTEEYVKHVDNILPDGPDKTYILRKLRGTAMWINVALTRLPDGTPMV